MIKLHAASVTLASIKLRLLLTLLALFCIYPLFADNGKHMVPISLEERISKSEIIVEGEVVSQKSFWNESQTNIYTSNLIKVYKVFKGTVQEQQIEIITLGGSVGLKKHVSSTALELYNGQQGMFFLMKETDVNKAPFNTKQHTRAYASQQGFVKYNLAQATAADVFETYSSVPQLYTTVAAKTGRNYRVVQENTQLQQALESKSTDTQTQSTLAVPVITSFSPTVTSAGTGTILTINGTNFGNTRGSGKVEFRNADDGGKTFMEPRLKDYISWTNTQIRVRIPSRGANGGTAGTGEIRVTAADGSAITSATQITIEFAVLNVALTQPNIRTFEPLLQNNNRKGGYTVRYAPSMQNMAAAQEGFRRALNTWTCATNMNWEVGSPTTIDAAKDDDVNVIRFAPGSSFGQEGVLASTLSYWEGYKCGTDTVFWLNEFDMSINSNINWQFGPGGPSGNQFDYETVILHELGHAHQLGHVILPRAVMHYAVEVRALVRDLSDADIRGGARIMSRSVQPITCNVPVTPIVPETQGDCNIAPQIVTFDGAFQGSQVVLTWTTQQEQNVKSYIVQRSQNGSEFTDIGTVAPKGAGSYTFTDTSPLPDISYYRLKVVYNDNSTRFSARKRVIDPRSLRKLSVYPNPVSPDVHTINLLYLVQASSTLSVQIYNTSGVQVRNLSIPVSDVNVPIKVSMKDLAAGLYILKWQERTNSGEFKILRL